MKVSGLSSLNEACNSYTYQNESHLNMIKYRMKGTCIPKTCPTFPDILKSCQYLKTERPQNHGTISISHPSKVMLKIILNSHKQKRSLQKSKLVSEPEGAPQNKYSISGSSSRNTCSISRISSTELLGISSMTISTPAVLHLC